MSLSSEQITVCNLALGLFGEVEIVGAQTSTKQYKLCDKFYVSTLKETLSEHNWNEHKKRAMLVEDSTAPLFGYSYRFAMPTDCIKLLRIGDGDNDWTEWEVEDGYILTDKAQSPATWTAEEAFVAGQYCSYSDITYLCATAYTPVEWASGDTYSIGDRVYLGSTLYYCNVANTASTSNSPATDETTWTAKTPATDTAVWTSQSGDYSVLYVEYIYYNTDTTSWSPRFLDAMVHNLAIKLVVPITNNPKNKDLLLQEYENLTLRKARSVDAQQGKPKTLFRSLWWNSRYGS